MSGSGSGDMSGSGSGDISGGGSGDISGGDSGDISGGDSGDMSGGGSGDKQQCDNPNSTNQNVDQTVKLEYRTMAGGFVYTDAGCSAIYSYSPIQDGTPTNYDTALQICNINDNTRPLPLAAIDRTNFCYNTNSATKDNYYFVSVKNSEYGTKCIRYVYLNNDFTADTTRNIVFDGDCDTTVDHNTIVNGEGFSNVKSKRKSEEHFESNKNLKCKHRY